MDTAKKAASTVTVVFDNGIQFSGVVEDFQSSNGQIQSLVLTGSKQVSFEGKVREEVSHHSLGADIYIPLFDPAVAALQMSDIQRKLHGSGLTTIDGSRIQGRFKKEVQFEQQARVLILEHVKITAADGAVIFEEHQKNYPLLIVSAVTSVFGGAADRTEFAVRHSNRKTKVKLHKSNRTNENSVLNELYDRVRLYRDGRKSQIELLDPVMGELNSNYPNDWLLRLELLELNLLQRKDSLLSARLRKEIIDISQRCPEQKEMILRGLELLS
jgi:phenylalanine-4-hydroxylase